jgi:hypothetical protein
MRVQRKTDDHRDAVDVHLLFRQVNDRVRTLNEAFEPLLPRGDWICECADSGCVERIEMTIDEYDAIRAHPRRFPAVAGHELVGIERVVEQLGGYVVVERTAVGGPRRIGVRFDSRDSDD